MAESAGGTIAPDLLAPALGYSGTNNGAYLSRIASARLFGVITGRGARIELTDRGRQILAGREPESSRSRREAFLAVPLFRAVADATGSGDGFLPEDLARWLIDDFGEPHDKARSAADQLVASAGQAWLIRRSAEGKLQLTIALTKFTPVDNTPSLFRIPQVMWRRGTRSSVGGAVAMAEDGLWLDEEHPAGPRAAPVVAPCGRRRRRRPHPGRGGRTGGTGGWRLHPEAHRGPRRGQASPARERPGRAHRAVCPQRHHRQRKFRLRLLHLQHPCIDQHADHHVDDGVPGGKGARAHGSRRSSEVPPSVPVVGWSSCMGSATSSSGTSSFNADWRRVGLPCQRSGHGADDSCIGIASRRPQVADRAGLQRAGRRSEPAGPGERGDRHQSVGHGGIGEHRRRPGRRGQGERHQRLRGGDR